MNAITIPQQAARWITPRIELLDLIDHYLANYRTATFDSMTDGDLALVFESVCSIVGDDGSGDQIHQASKFTATDEDQLLAAGGLVIDTFRGRTGLANAELPTELMRTATLISGQIVSILRYSLRETAHQTRLAAAINALPTTGAQS